MISLFFNSASYVSPTSRTRSMLPLRNMTTVLGGSIQSVIIVCLCSRWGLFEKSVKKIENARYSRTSSIPRAGNIQSVVLWSLCFSIFISCLQNFSPTREVRFGRYRYGCNSDDSILSSIRAGDNFDSMFEPFPERFLEDKFQLAMSARARSFFLKGRRLGCTSSYASFQIAHHCQFFDYVSLVRTLKSFTWVISGITPMTDIGCFFAFRSLPVFNRWIWALHCSRSYVSLARFGVDPVSTRLVAGCTTKFVIPTITRTQYVSFKRNATFSGSISNFISVISLIGANVVFALFVCVLRSVPVFFLSSCLYIVHLFGFVGSKAVY